MIPVYLILLVQTGIVCGLLYLGRQQARFFFHRLMHKLETIIMKASELAARLATVEDVLTKVQAEVQALKDSTADADLPAEAVAALDRLSTLVNTIDQINPDVSSPGAPLPEG